MNRCSIRDIVAGMIKSLLFGLIIGLISCYKGLTVRGGAAGVGDATTSSVVMAITTVIGFDTLMQHRARRALSRLTAALCTARRRCAYRCRTPLSAKRTSSKDSTSTCRPRERLVIMGQSGSGKSTTAPADHGHPAARRTAACNFKGQEVTRMSRRRLNQMRQKIGMVYQYSALI